MKYASLGESSRALNLGFLQSHPLADIFLEAQIRCSVVSFFVKKAPPRRGFFMCCNGLGHPTPGPKNARGAHMTMSGMKMHMINPSHCRQTNGTTPL